MGERAPTKSNLIAAKHSKELAEMGYELMDRKRNILVRELMGLIDRATELQSRIDSTFSEAYDALRLAGISMSDYEDIAAAIPIDDSIKLRYRSVMGVELPSVSTDTEPDGLMPYGLVGTTSSLDEAYVKFHRVKSLIIEMAELENSIYRLAYSIEKARKRTNALHNIVIPCLDADISRITEVLEEKDREEFVRLKVVKSKR